MKWSVATAYRCADETGQRSHPCTLRVRRCQPRRFGAVGVQKKRPVPVPSIGCSDRPNGGVPDACARLRNGRDRRVTNGLNQLVVHVSVVPPRSQARRTQCHQTAHGGTHADSTNGRDSSAALTQRGGAPALRSRGPVRKDRQQIVSRTDIRPRGSHSCLLSLEDRRSQRVDSPLARICGGGGSEERAGARKQRASASAYLRRPLPDGRFATVLDLRHQTGLSCETRTPNRTHRALWLKPHGSLSSR